MFKQDDLFHITNALLIHRNIYARRIKEPITPDYRVFCENKVILLNDLIQKVRKYNETCFSSSSK